MFIRKSLYVRRNPISRKSSVIYEVEDLVSLVYSNTSVFQGSNDNNTKFWSRNRPGDTQDDIFGLASFSGNALHATAKEAKAEVDEETVIKPVIPGTFYFL